TRLFGTSLAITRPACSTCRTVRAPETAARGAVPRRSLAMSIHQSDVDRLERRVASALHSGWKYLLIEGIVLVVLGAAAIVIPPIATLAVEIIVGWLFLLSGILGLAMTFMMRGAPGFWWSLFSGVLAIAAGVVLI